MRSRTAVVAGSLVAALVAGIVVMLLTGGKADRTVTQDLGVIPNGPIVLLAKGSEACQTPLALADDVDRVGVFLGPFTAPRGPVDIVVKSRSSTGRELARAVLPEGNLPSGPVNVALDRKVRGDRFVALCIVNNGRRKLELIGDIDSGTGLAPPKRFAGRVLQNPTRSTDELEVDGKVRVGHDVSAYFPASEPKTLLDRIPSAFRHAATFKIAGMGAWVFWVLLGALVLVAPFLLVRAVSATAAEDDAADGPRD